MNKNIHNPIILIGSGRSGSSIIYEALSQHPNMSFFSQYCTRVPALPELTFIHRFFNYYRKKEQWHKQKVLQKIRPSPKEAYNIWQKLCGNKFRYTFLKKIKATNYERSRVLSYVRILMNSQRSNRFIIKLTGPPRTYYLSSIFNDPFFIDIIRDPRAVVNSMLKVDFRQRKIPKAPFWWDSLTKTDLKAWEKYDKSPIALSALEWMSIFRQTKREIEMINPKYIQIKYEDFIQKPIQLIKLVLKISGMEYSEKVINFIKNQKYVNTNYKFKRNLSDKNIEIITNICHKAMTILKYL